MDRVEDADASEVVTPNRAPLGAFSRRSLDNNMRITGASPHNTTPSSIASTLESSPDEMVIRFRGRRNPSTWSPYSVKGVKKLCQDATPTKDMISGNSLRPPTRKSPCKKLDLSIITREQSAHGSLFNEKLPKDIPTLHIATALNALTRAQLIKVIVSLTESYPHLNQDLRSALPEPDIQPLLEKLTYLKKNILKSMPNTRLSSTTDSVAFNKAQVHLSSFKKCLIDYGQRLVDSEAWHSVLEFSLQAWPIVKATPSWSTAKHNAVKNSCFKFLSSNCLKALKSHSWTASEKSSFRERLEQFRCDGSFIEPCLNFFIKETHDIDCRDLTDTNET